MVLLSSGSLAGCDCACSGRTLPGGADKAVTVGDDPPSGKSGMIEPVEVRRRIGVDGKPQDLVKVAIIKGPVPTHAELVTAH